MYSIHHKNPCHESQDRGWEVYRKLIKRLHQLAVLFLAITKEEKHSPIAGILVDFVKSTRARIVTRGTPDPAWHDIELQIFEGISTRTGNIQIGSAPVHFLFHLRSNSISTHVVETLVGPYIAQRQLPQFFRAADLLFNTNQPPSDMIITEAMEILKSC